MERDFDPDLEPVEKIHKATLDILLHQGVVFQSQEALAIFQDHGVKVDSQIFVIHYQTGFLRDSTKLDVAESAKLSDYLDTLDYTQALTARDCPFRAIDLHEAEAFLCNTTKHCMHGSMGGKENIKNISKWQGCW